MCFGDLRLPSAVADRGIKWLVVVGGDRWLWAVIGSSGMIGRQSKVNTLNDQEECRERGREREGDGGEVENRVESRHE